MKRTMKQETLEQQCLVSRSIVKERHLVTGCVYWANVQAEDAEEDDPVEMEDVGYA